jgi:hypothetical protein
LKAQPKHHDFGRVPNTKAVKRVFELRNIGGEPLHIERVRPACGCTVTELTRETVPPGAATRLTARIDLAGMKGSIEKVIRLHTNAGRANLWMEGDARNRLQVAPGALHFGRLKRQSEKRRIISVTTPEGPGLRVENVESNAEWLRATHEWAHADGTAHRIRVQLVPPLPDGGLDGRVRIRTSLEEKQVLEVPVSGYVAGKLAVSPPALKLAPGEKNATRHVIVGPGSVKDFQVKKVVPPLEQIQTRVRKVGRHGYRIRVAHLTASGALEGAALRIHTDIAGLNVVEVPFRIHARKEKP